MFHKYETQSFQDLPKPWSLDKNPKFITPNPEPSPKLSNVESGVLVGKLTVPLSDLSHHRVGVKNWNAKIHLIQ